MLKDKLLSTELFEDDEYLTRGFSFNLPRGRKNRRWISNEELHDILSKAHMKDKK